MAPHITHLPHAATHRFPPLVLDYLAGAEGLKPFYRFAPDWAGISEAIEARKSQPVDREILCSLLEKQYRGLRQHPALQQNLERLRNEKTFTICTAHQPNLATGYLYFVYKILHAIRLAEDLAAQHPEHHFVPVYYLGSEDADLDELGTFRYGDRKFVWDGDGQHGAVGRMRTDSLKPLLDGLFSLLGPPGTHTDRLKTLLHDAYLGQPTIATATRFLVNEAFGAHGLVVLDADEPEAKRALLPVFRKDLFENTSAALVKRQAEALEAAGYSAQAYPRDVNLFYLNTNLRERIERQGEQWVVLNTDLRFSSESLEALLQNEPEKFSPNVVLRGLLQESILPNVAFIGGGAEVAYWMQLLPLFRHHNVFFPPVLLRASAQWLSASANRTLGQLGFRADQAFGDEASAFEALLSKDSSERWRMDAARQTLQDLGRLLEEQAAGLDSTLRASASAAAQDMLRSLQRLEEKAQRAQRRAYRTEIDRFRRLEASLFPGGVLQERVENFLPYYAQYGPEFFEWIKAGLDPLGRAFLVGTLPEEV